MPNLPYFKFDTTSWLTGKVQLLTAAEKGIFIDLVSRIWNENGYLNYSEILHRQLRVDKATLSDAIQAFCELGIMENGNGFLSVKFIVSQIEERESYTERQREFGARGGRPKKATLKPKSPREEKEEKEIKETSPSGEVKKNPAPAFYPKDVDEVMKMSEDPRCACKITRQQAETYFLARDTADWIDACGRKIAPGKVFGDLRRWALRDAEKGGSATAAKDDGSFAEYCKRSDELDRAAKEWE